MTYNVAILLCTCLWRQLLWASEVCSLWWRLQISQETKMMRHLLHSSYVIHINAKKIACTIRPRENSRGIWFPHYFLEWKYYMYKYHWTTSYDDTCFTPRSDHAVHSNTAQNNFLIFFLWIWLYSAIISAELFVVWKIRSTLHHLKHDWWNISEVIIPLKELTCLAQYNTIKTIKILHLNNIPPFFYI